MDKTSTKKENVNEKTEKKLTNLKTSENLYQAFEKHINNHKDSVAEKANKSFIKKSWQINSKSFINDNKKTMELNSFIVISDIKQKSKSETNIKTNDKSSFKSPSGIYIIQKKNQDLFYQYKQLEVVHPFDLKSYSFFQRLPIQTTLKTEQFLNIMTDNILQEIPVLPPSYYEQQLHDIKNLVSKAKNERKTFTVIGNFFTVRKELLARGWIEKIRVSLIDDIENYRQIESLPCLDLVEGISNPAFGEKYRRVLISKLLAGHQVDLYWDYCSNPFTVNSDKVKQTIINRYPALCTKPYANKEALSATLNDNSHWFCIEGKSNILYPRTFNLSYDYDKKAFIKEFQRTAAVSLLFWLSSTNNNETETIISDSGTVPISVYKFAVRQCQNYLKTRQHKDIDDPITEEKDYNWMSFLTHFYEIMHDSRLFKNDDHNKFTSDLLIHESRLIISQLRPYCPNMSVDGFMNVWILKPHRGSQGYGITVCRTLSHILNIVQHNPDRKYVIQKYIERPLLIHDTKFDIRQWFLVTHRPKLQVWMYRDCYLRFSSQKYNLNNLHESIHLTNNSVQCRYKNRQRNPALPSHNMWHSDTFRCYLSDTGHALTWQNKIYKGMKECIIGVIMCSQDRMPHRQNSFELWGTDFMLDEQFNPYLIEINTRPALGPSTYITSRLGPQVIGDIIKVIVDHAQNDKASTGQFELIYEDPDRYPVKDKEDAFVITGINYVRKYKARKNRKKCISPEFTESPIEERRPISIIKTLLNIDPNEVKSNVKGTLEKILSRSYSDQNKDDTDTKTGTRTEQFKNLLSEFVNILSTPILTGPVKL